MDPCTHTHTHISWYITVKLKCKVAKNSQVEKGAYVGTENYRD